MIRIILSGCCGKMGAFIREGINNYNDMEIVAGVDVIDNPSLGFPVFQSFSDINIKADVIIDFSRPVILHSLLEYAAKNSVPAVIATTGLTDDDINSIKVHSENNAVFFSYNMSIGVNLISELAKAAAKALGKSFDVEIVEAHHNQKVDAPSGTAIMLADAVKEVLPDSYYKYDRHSEKGKRSGNEIGIHSIRGGTIVGEHEVIFAGKDEIIKISHSARSRAIFAEGAINAARFISTKKNGIYSMKDIINS